MAADFNHPIVGDLYTDVLDMVRANDINCITLGLVAAINTPTGAIKWDRSTLLFREWGGAAYADLVLALAGGGTGSANAAGARTNLGLGSMATQNSNAVTITAGSITGITLAGTLSGTLALNGQTLSGTGTFSGAIAFSSTITVTGTGTFGSGTSLWKFTTNYLNGYNATQKFLRSDNGINYILSGGTSLSVLDQAETTVLTAITNTGILSVNGLGSHTFNATGTGGQTLHLSNLSAGAGNYAEFGVLGNVDSAIYLQAFSSTYSGGTTGPFRLNGSAIQLSGTNGGTIYGQGDIRFYTGAADRGIIDAAGTWKMGIVQNFLWVAKTVGTIYQAASDGFVVAYGGFTVAGQLSGITDNSATPTTTVTAGSSLSSEYISITFPVKKGDYYKVSASSTLSASGMNWVPLGYNG